MKTSWMYSAKAISLEATATVVGNFCPTSSAWDGPESTTLNVSLFSMTRTLLEHEGVAWRDVPPATFAERARAMLLLSM